MAEARSTTLRRKTNWLSGEISEAKRRFASPNRQASANFRTSPSSRIPRGRSESSPPSARMESGFTTA